MNFEQERLAMVQSQLRPNGIHDARLLAVYQDLPRHIFSGASSVQAGGMAYLDEDWQVATGRILMEPVVEALLMQEAAIGQDELILVIGAWPGNLAAVAARLGSAVIALENDSSRIPRLQALFDTNGVPNVFVTREDLQRGYPARSPYDAILFGAGVPKVPMDICDQLAIGGRAVAVERPQPDAPGELCCYRRDNTGITRHVICEAFIPLLPEFIPDTTDFAL